MRKKKLIVACVFGFCSALMYLSIRFKEDTLSVMKTHETVYLNIVLKDDQNRLIPLTVQSDCTDEMGCLNHALDLMSHSYDQLHAVLPLPAQVLSLDCDERCVVNFSKEILEFPPAKRSQVEQVLSLMLKDYDHVELRVENQITDAIQLHDVFLNPVHFVEQDYTKGYFYQMYQMKHLNHVDLLVPVLIFAKCDDPLSVIEEFYSSLVSVQFDNVNFQSVQIIEGNPYRLILSGECMDKDGLVMNEILPILHSLKQHTDAQEIEIVVCDVIVDKINLNELILNEIHLSD